MLINTILWIWHNVFIIHFITIFFLILELDELEIEDVVTTH